MLLRYCKEPFWCWAKFFRYLLSGIAHIRSVLPNKKLGHHHSPGCRRLFRLVFLGQLFSQLTLAINNFLEIMEIFSPPQLVPSGLTTGTLSTCRRMSSEGMSLSDIAILLASQWQYLICIWNLLALNIRMVTAKNSSQHLNPCMLMFSDFAWRLLKSSHDRN